MNPWIIIAAIMAGIVFGIDYLLRKKKWKDNSKAEKISLLINMFSAGPYVFLSALGMLWGIVPSSPETTFGEVLYDATLYMGGAYFAVAFAALIASLILRKTEKIKASIWVNIIALIYIVAVLTMNSIVGKVF